MKEREHFFSVRFTTTMDGVVYRPSMCYPVTPLIADAVASLVRNNQAVAYEREVRFVSGIAYPVNEPLQRQPAERPAEQPVRQAPKPRKGARIQF